MRYRYPWFYVYPYEVRRPPAPANNIDTFIRSAKYTAGIFADAQLVPTALRARGSSRAAF